MRFDIFIFFENQNYRDKDIQEILQANYSKNVSALELIQRILYN